MQTWMRIPLVAVGLAGLAATVACGSSMDGSKVGNLGRGSFKYTCISDDGDDSTCPLGATKTRSFDFPAVIAVGGAFKMTYDANSDVQTQLGNPILKPASPDFLSDDAPEVFVARRPGRVAIVARSSANGKAADYTYVRIAQPLTLKMKQTDNTERSTLTVASGQTFSLHAEAYADHDLRLAGTVSYDWVSDDKSVVALNGVTPNARMVFKAGNPGTTKLTAKLDQLTVSIDVTVTQ